MSFIPLKPIPIKDRNSMIFVGMGRIDVKDGAFVVIDEVNGERMHTPIGSIACLMPKPPEDVQPPCFVFVHLCFSLKLMLFIGALV